MRAVDWWKGLGTAVHPGASATPRRKQICLDWVIGGVYYCIIVQTYKRATQSVSAELEGLLSPDFFRALSDPNRIILLAQLCERGEPSTVTEAAECCAVDLSVVSRHLATLRDAGLIVGEKRGREMFYTVDYSRLSQTLRSIADAINECCPPDQKD